MQDPKDPIPQASRREPWNKGKLIGQKPPLRPNMFLTTHDPQLI